MSFTEIRAKLRHFRGRPSFDQNLEEELRLHVESRAEELIASGLTGKEAFLQARREFGSLRRMAEESREAWRWKWIEDALLDLRYGARSLAKNPALAATAIVSLALGIGLNTAIFSLTMAFLFSQPSVRDPNSFVQVIENGGRAYSMREFEFLRDAKVFAGLAGANPMQEVNWRNGDVSRRLFVTLVTDNFFEVTGAPVAMGRAIQPGDRGVAVISDGFWRNRMQQDPKVAGRLLVLDGRPYTIAGVLPAGHRTLTGFGYAPDLYLPIENELTRVAAYGRVDSDMSAVLGRLQTAAREMDRVFPERRTPGTVSVMRLTGADRLRQGFLPTVSAFFALLLAVTGLLLLIACANVASLLLARASARVQEFAIRMSIGAGRSRLMRQMLAESLLLSLAGTAAGLALNWLLTRWMSAIPLAMPFPLRLSIEPDTRLLIYSAAVSIFCALVAGLLPALRATRLPLGVLMKQDERQVTSGRATFRNILVSGQLAVSVLVLIVAVLSLRNLMLASELDPGFDIRRTVWAQVRLVPERYSDIARVRAFTAAALDQLAAAPGAESATVATFVPLNDHFASRTTRFFTDTLPQGERIEHSWNAVGPNYLKTMGIGLIAGREFSLMDREGAPRVVIINESLARHVFGAVNPIGRRIRFGREDQLDRTVAGVARNSKYSTIGERDRAAVYEPYFQAGGRPALNFLVKAKGSAESLISPINVKLLEADSSAAVELRTMSAAMSFAMLPSRMGAALLGTTGLLGLALASVGLYGVISYSISRRTREIGLRMALGAQRGDVLRLVLREGTWILGAGVAIGVFLGFFVTRPLVKFLVPGLHPSDPATYLAVVIALAVVGLCACLSPALRALRIDPMTALRYE